jgi:predicted DNA-binding WGR domain protein
LISLSFRLVSDQPVQCQRRDNFKAYVMNAVHLRRVDSAQNMRRFYRLDVQPDLFGGVLLVKEWGRIGAQGRMVAEPYDCEALAAEALQRQAARKRKRGYLEAGGD